MQQVVAGRQHHTAKIFLFLLVIAFVSFSFLLLITKLPNSYSTSTTSSLPLTHSNDGILNIKIKNHRKDFTSSNNNKLELKNNESTNKKYIRNDGNDGRKKIKVKKVLVPSEENWSPIQIDKCVDGMYKYSAPCLYEHYNELNQTNLEKGIELIYHSFKIRAPMFYNEKQKLEWIEKSKRIKMMKWSNNNEWAIYFSSNGQILIFSNVYIDQIIDSDNWKSTSCMGDSHSHLPFFKTKPTMNTIKQYNFNYKKNPSINQKYIDVQVEEQYESVDSLILSTSPDSFSFQHFLDRVTVTWSQSTIYQKEDSESRSILSGLQSFNPIIRQLYSIMVDSHYHQTSIHAKKLIYSCRSPLTHPYTTQRIYDEMLRKFRVNFNIPIEKRKKIVYFSRQDADTVNIGRRIVNETLMVDYLNIELKKRRKNEELIIFESYDYQNLESLFKLFNDTKLIFGPHGAAFYNSRFAPKQLAVLEILPTGGFYYNGFWEQASLLEQTYGVYYADKVNEKNDMIINDIPNFTKYLFGLIDACQHRKPTDILEKHYPWNVGL